MTPYRAYLLVTTAAGALPAIIFTVLFLAVDRPSVWDRVTRLIRDLAILLAVGFTLPFLLVLLSLGQTPPQPTAWWQWVINVGVRAFAAVFIWRLLWVYVTPHRSRRRRAEPSDAPDQ